MSLMRFLIDASQRRPHARRHAMEPHPRDRIGGVLPLNVHRGVDMSIVGILAWKSCLANGAPVEVPDFRKAAVCKQWQDDNWSPLPEDAGPGQPPPSIAGVRKFTAEQKANARKTWKAMGYKGK